MDFGPDKLDSQLLLDYGVLDTAQPQVTCVQRSSGAKCPAA